MAAMNPADAYLRASYSSLNTYESCERKFELSKLYPRRSGWGPAFAADVGKALHSGYQNYMVHQDRESAAWAYMLEYPYALEYEQANDWRSAEAGLATLDEMFDSLSMAEYELATIRRPATADELAADPLTTHYDVPAIEVPFEIRFKGITLPDGRGLAFVGFIDAIVRNIINGRYRTLDIKTHRRHMQDATAKYKFDDQQTPYGIIVEHIQGNPIEEFEVVYLDCFVDVLEPRVQIYQFTRTQEEIQEWLLNKVLQFQRIQRSLELGRYFPRTSGGCMSFNRPCHFLEVCQSRDSEMIEAWLLGGDEPAPTRYEVPWVVAEIDVFAGRENQNA